MNKSGVVKKKDLLYPELSYKIIGCAFDVHNELGCGHAEKVYQKALAESFSKNSISFAEQVNYTIRYNNKLMSKRIMDFLIDNVIVVEIKKDNRFSKSHIDQVLEYLKINDKKLAILINFGKEGVSFKRIINIS